MSEQKLRRQRRKTLNDNMVAALPRRAKRYVMADPDQRGLYIRVVPKGPNVYAAVARDPYGKQNGKQNGKQKNGNQCGRPSATPTRSISRKRRDDCAQGDPAHQGRQASIRADAGQAGLL